MVYTAFHPEPSAKAPCTITMFFTTGVCAATGLTRISRLLKIINAAIKYLFNERSLHDSIFIFLFYYKIIQQNYYWKMSVTMAKLPKMMDCFLWGLAAVLAFCTVPDVNERLRAFLNEFLYNWGEKFILFLKYRLK